MSSRTFSMKTVRCVSAVFVMLILTITPAPGSYIPQNNYNTTHLSIFLFTHLTPLPGKPMNNCKRCQDSPSTAGEVCWLVLRCPADCSSHDSGKCLQFSGETPPCSRPAAALQPPCSRHAAVMQPPCSAACCSGPDCSGPGLWVL